MATQDSSNFYCPEKYKDKVFLTVCDMKEILQLGENKTYEFLKDAPFKVIKVGNQIRVSAMSFWKWYSE